MSADTKGPVYVIVYAALIAALFTGGIMALHTATRDIVVRNEDLFRQKAFVELFGLGDVDTLTDQETVDLYDSRIRREDDVTDPQTHQTFEVYSAVDDQGDLIGQAFSVSGTGFWARIDGFLAVNISTGEIIGITFLQHQETPGLGGRITERQWRQKFKGLTISPNPAGQFIYIGGNAPEPGSPSYGRHVDAISGATGTSSAVERFLNEQIAAYIRAVTDGKSVIEIPY